MTDTSYEYRYNNDNGFRRSPYLTPEPIKHYQQVWDDWNDVSKEEKGDEIQEVAYEDWPLLSGDHFNARSYSDLPPPFHLPQHQPRSNHHRKLCFLGSTRTVLLAIALVLSFTLFYLLHSSFFSRDDVLGARVRITKDAFFDYIIVGGGPSGIIVASKLAKAFPDLRVLLIESGTESQASVLRTTTSAAEKSTPKAASASTTFESRGSSTQEGVAKDEGGNQQLNVFDIPLLWSGLAASWRERERRYSPSSSLEHNNKEGDDSDPSFLSTGEHYWPIEKTVLARALGGCGLLNAMVYIRALPSDFEGWNMSGWSFDDMLPHYKALENYQPDDQAHPPPFWPPEESSVDSTEHLPWRGYDGPVTTLPAGAIVDAIAPLFVQSALFQGMRLASRGFNEPSVHGRLGVGYYEFNIKNGVRDSIARAFLGEQERPRNLQIRTGITVTRVLLDDERGGTRACGVEYLVEATGRVGRFLVTDTQFAEIILTAGAIMTPQLLENSGIGKGGSVVDLPGVGHNLQDHPVVGVSFALQPEAAMEASSVYTLGDDMDDYLDTVALLESPEIAESNLTDSQLYEIHRQLGPLATSGFSAGGFLRSPWTADDDSPDIQITVYPRQSERHVLRHTKREEISQRRSQTMLVTVALLRPDARYKLSAGKFSGPSENVAEAQTRSKVMDTGDKNLPLSRFKVPSINLPSNSSDKDASSSSLSQLDLQRLAWGVEQVRRVQETAPLSLHTGVEVHPGAKMTGDSLLEYIRRSVLPSGHWVGSARMGHAEDSSAVVDERLSVHGVGGLRVADASVIPQIPNGNTHSTVCVVASQAADLIAEDRQGGFD